MHKVFSFKGVNKATDDVVAQEGECLEVVNLRMCNGSLRPVPLPEKVAVLGYAYSGIFLHPMTGYYLCITDDGARTLHFYDSSWEPLMSGTSMFIFDDLRNVRSVEFVGNVVCCLTGKGIMYILFDNGQYNWLGERPSIPPYTVSVSSKVQQVVTEDAYAITPKTEEIELSWSYNEKGYIDESISRLNADRYYIDRALFRVALRLYDGTYINSSNVIYVSDNKYEDCIGRDGMNMYSEPVEIIGTSAKYSVKTRGMRVNFSFDTSELARWKNVVVGIDVFSTVSIPGKMCKLQGRAVLFEAYTAKTPNELWEDIASASLFYKVAEFDVEGKLQHLIADVSPVNLALQEVYGTVGNFSSLNTIDAGCSYMFNNRLHIASLREYFFKGYGEEMVKPVSTPLAIVTAVVMHTTIRSAQGTYVVENRTENAVLGWNGFELELSPLLSYPDARACCVDVYVLSGSSIRYKHFPYTAHKMLDMSYYLHKWHSPYTVSVNAVFANGGRTAAVDDDDVLSMFNRSVGVHEVVYSASRGSWMYNGSAFPESRFASLRVFALPHNIVDGDKLVFTIKYETSDYSFKDIHNIPVDDSWSLVDEVPEISASAFEERSNVLKVSMVENPFVFPASATYTPSQGEIIALSSNTVALSQGQFGEYPLFVFCTDGIWAMSVDSSGSIAYIASRQVSRDVCVNSSTVCGIGSGVVFATSQGMMLIVGSELKKFSTAMDGNDSALFSAGNGILDRIASLVSLDASIGQVQFNGYIGNAAVTYAPGNNEIVICNGLYDWSFVYSFSSGCWSRLSGRLNGAVRNSTGQLMSVVENGATRIVALSEELCGDNKVLLFTRPQLWGTKLPKRVQQLLLHAYAEPPLQTTAGMPMLACYMLCSNDGVNFKLVAGSEKNAATQDVLFPYFPTQSYKYFLFAIVGEMGERSMLSAFELDVDVAWNNRLR